MNSKEKLINRVNVIIEKLENEYTDAKIALDYNTPFELLIATILAAQCTDLRVNLVTPKLFEKFPTPHHYIKATLEEIEKEIFSTGFYKNKAKSIQNASYEIVNNFGGEVPNTMENLLKLRGVGRKTANVILGHCFNKPVIVVDTHVKRISNLLSLVNSNSADEIEFELLKIIQENKQTNFSHLIANHGRAICIARRPKCSICVINKLCPSNIEN